jgi:mannonate dehydratase
VHEVFPGTLRPARGYLTPSDRPGWGIDIDESRADRYPPQTHLFEQWATRIRRPDGAIEPP